MDDSVFESIHRETARSIWAYIYRLTGDGAAADDILQETYLRLLRSPPKENSLREVRPYLFKIATNLARDRFRGLKRWKGSNDVLMTDDSHEASFYGDTEMMHYFSQLKQRERSLLWLAYVEGYDHNEIGHILKLRPGAVRVLLFRARRKLAVLLGEEKK